MRFIHCVVLLAASTVPSTTMANGRGLPPAIDQANSNGSRNFPEGLREGGWVCSNLRAELNMWSRGGGQPMLDCPNW